jgi:hypothetical protein
MTILECGTRLSLNDTLTLGHNYWYNLSIKCTMLLQKLQKAELAREQNDEL